MISASAVRAAAMATAGVRVMKALSCGSSASVRLSSLSQYSTGDSLRPQMRRAASAKVRSCSSADGMAHLRDTGCHCGGGARATQYSNAPGESARRGRGANGRVSTVPGGRAGSFLRETPGGRGPNRQANARHRGPPEWALAHLGIPEPAEPATPFATTMVSGAHVLEDLHGTPPCCGPHDP